MALLNSNFSDHERVRGFLKENEGLFAVVFCPSSKYANHLIDNIGFFPLGANEYNSGLLCY